MCLLVSTQSIEYQSGQCHFPPLLQLYLSTKVYLLRIIMLHRNTRLPQSLCVFLSSHLLSLSLFPPLSLWGNKVTKMPTLHRLHLPASVLQSATFYQFPWKQTANENADQGAKVCCKSGLLHHCLNIINKHTHTTDSTFS